MAPGSLVIGVVRRQRAAARVGAGGVAGADEQHAFGRREWACDEVVERLARQVQVGAAASPSDRCRVTRRADSKGS
jgi:hypothetical protein